MLLSDEEISDLWVTELDDRETVSTFARAIQAAILAKLVAKELPEPVGAYELVVGQEEWQGFPSEIIEMRDAYSAAQLQEAHAQGFAAGAASQLAEKPSGYLSQYNLEMLQQGYPQTIVMIEGAKRDVPLYTRREA